MLLKVRPFQGQQIPLLSSLISGGFSFQRVEFAPPPICKFLPIRMTQVLKGNNVFPLQILSIENRTQFKKKYTVSHACSLGHQEGSRNENLHS